MRPNVVPEKWKINQKILTLPMRKIKEFHGYNKIGLMNR